MENQAELANLFSQHISALTARYAEGLAAAQLENPDACLLIHSGCQHYYFADDRAVPFQAFGHFLHWVPLNRPDQFLIVRPGAKPQLLQLVPSDFWHDQRLNIESWWADCFDIKAVPDLASLAALLPPGPLYFLGAELDEVAKSLGRELKPTPALLWSYLDYYRAYKSEYELKQLRQASVMGLRGHHAAKEAFLAGASEYQIHQAFLSACEVLEDQTPYTNIVALDSNSAILHYQYKSHSAASDSKVLLIDAGFRQRGYGSDITRTWTRDGSNETFQALVQAIENIELALVDQVKIGSSYQSLHESTMLSLADLLIELGICQGDQTALMEAEIPQQFMPHGVGHLLGIQVHDVAGHQQDAAGTIAKPPSSSPALRLTRELAENMVFTLEPGCYFIPVLLEPLREQSRGKLINFDKVEQLYPLGGVRIEDNIRVTADGAENLTRNAEAA